MPADVYRTTAGEMEYRRFVVKARTSARPSLAAPRCCCCCWLLHSVCNHRCTHTRAEGGRKGRAYRVLSARLVCNYRDAKTNGSRNYYYSAAGEKGEGEEGEKLATSARVPKTIRSPVYAICSSRRYKGSSSGGKIRYSPRALGL